MALETVKIPDLPSTSSPSNTDQMIIRTGAGVQRIDYANLKSDIVNAAKDSGSDLSFSTVSVIHDDDYILGVTSSGQYVKNMRGAFLHTPTSGSGSRNSSSLSAAESLNYYTWGAICCLAITATTNAISSKTAVLASGFPRAYMNTRFIGEVWRKKDGSVAPCRLTINTSGQLVNDYTYGDFAANDQITAQITYVCHPNG